MENWGVLFGVFATVLSAVISFTAVIVGVKVYSKVHICNLTKNIESLARSVRDLVNAQKDDMERVYASMHKADANIHTRIDLCMTKESCREWRKDIEGDVQCVVENIQLSKKKNGGG